MERISRGPRASALDRISAMTRGYERAVQEIRRSADPERRYAEATVLAAELVRLARAAGALRAEAAREIRDRDGISHRELARRLKISPTMADRLLRRGAGAEGEPDIEDDAPVTDSRES